MDDVTVEVKVGRVENIITEMAVSVVTKSDGTQEVRLWVTPKSGRRTGEMLMLSVEQYQQMRRVMQAVDAQLKI